MSQPRIKYHWVNSLRLQGLHLANVNKNLPYSIDTVQYITKIWGRIIWANNTAPLILYESSRMGDLFLTLNVHHSIIKS